MVQRLPPLSGLCDDCKMEGPQLKAKLERQKKEAEDYNKQLEALVTKQNTEKMDEFFKVDREKQNALGALEMARFLGYLTPAEFDERSKKWLG